MRTEDMGLLAAALAGDGEEDQGTNPETIPGQENPPGPGPLNPPENEDIPAPLTQQSLGRGVQLRFENLPMPGSLTFPIVMLLLFFFLLIPVNGHTRAVWLWLTLTGNASISAGGGGGGQPVIQSSSPGIPAPYSPSMTVGSYVQELY